MQDYGFEKIFEGVMWPIKDGQVQMDQQPEISYQIRYRDGLDIQDVTKRLIANFVESIDAWSRCQEKEAAREQMVKAMPMILKLLNDKGFADRALESGYRFDPKVVFKAFTDAAGWKIDVEEVFQNIRKES